MQAELQEDEPIGDVDKMERKVEGICRLLAGAGMLVD